MARGLDHIVHAVRDLDAAAELYRRLGFTVGARNKHPWGTDNYIVQLPGFFVELLTVADPAKLGDDAISVLFGRYNKNFLEQGEGFSLLVLESADSQADVDAFSANGIAASERLHFERDAKRPDGKPIKVAFSLAFAENKAAQSVHFAICQQHHPENFWNPAFQQHKNGVRSVAGVVLVAGKPAEHRSFLSSYTGVSTVRGGPTSLSFETPRGEIAVMDPVGFRSRFGSAGPTTANGARLAAVRFTVADLSATADLLMSDNVPFADAAGQIVIGGGTAMGATLVFEDQKAGPA